jgi:hypothetical protein
VLWRGYYQETEAIGKAEEGEEEDASDRECGSTAKSVFGGAEAGVREAGEAGEVGERGKAGKVGEADEAGKVGRTGF